jgi:hypothetical protein
MRSRPHGLFVMFAVLGSTRADASAPDCSRAHVQPPPAIEGSWRLEPAPSAMAESVRIDCTNAGCTFERELVVTNATDAVYDGLVLEPFEVLGATGIRAPLTDLVSKDAYGPLLRKLCEGMDEAKCLIGVGTGPAKEIPSTAPRYAYGTPLRIEPGQTARLSQGRYPISFWFPPRPEDIPSGCSGGARPAPIHTRHLLLGAWPERRPHTGRLVVAATGTVSITFPSHWTVAIAGIGPRTIASDGSGRSVLTTIAPGPVTIERTLPASSFIRRGGAFIAAGGFVEDRSGRFAMRAGYEVAHIGWLIYSAAVNTNFDRVIVAPAIEAALPTYWHTHWAVGVGVPIELAERRGVGGRVQVSLHMLGLGMVSAMDYFPASDDRVFSMFGQLSL